MSQYLTVQTFADITIMPPEYVAVLEAQHAGWLLKTLARWSDWIDAVLAKRYATPFSAPAPLLVEEWLCRIVTWRAYLKRGIDATDAQTVDIKEDADKAIAEVRDAAERKEGLFELPLRADLPGSQGIVRGGPLGYTEVSPYTWSELQRDAAADEGSGIF